MMTVSSSLFTSKPRWYFLIFLLCLVTGLTFVRGLDHGFVAEDFSSVLDAKITFGQLIDFILNSVRTRPTPYIFQWLTTRFFDMNPFWPHFFMLGFHILTVALTVLVTTKITNDKRIGIVAGLLFAIYPRHHQPVMWFAANPFTMMGFFCLLCLYAFYSYLDTRKLRWQLLGIVCYIALLITHETGAVFVGLLIYVDMFVHPTAEGFRWLRKRNFYLKYLPYLIILAIYLFVTFGGGRLFKLTGEVDTAALNEFTSVGGAGDTYRLTGLSLTGVKDMVAYITYGVFPQIPLRSMSTTDPVSLLASALAVLIVAALFFKGNRVMRFGIVWAIVMLVPTVLFVPFGNADRYLYLPAIGLAITASSLLFRIYDRYRQSRPTEMQIVVGGVLVVYTISSIALLQARINEWHRAGELAADIIDQTVRLYPEPVPDSTFLFVGLPESYEQAYVFLGGGIGSGILLKYGEHDTSSNMDIYKSRDESLRDALINATETIPNPTPNLYVLLYDDGVVIDKTSYVADPAILNRSDWSR